MTGDDTTTGPLDDVTVLELGGIGPLPLLAMLFADLGARVVRVDPAGPAYGTIVGFGSNGAVLHFDPTHREVKPGELVLIDAGAELSRYSADVTRTFACGAPDGARKELHASVLRAFERAIARCTVGTEWIDVHVGAALDMAEGLVQMGVLKVSASSAVESGAMGLFFPHGLGHLIGLGVRDASGRKPGRTPSKRPGVVTIRCDFPLEAGFGVVAADNGTRKPAYCAIAAWRGVPCG